MSYLEKIKLPMRMQIEIEDVFARRSVGLPSIDACQTGIFQRLRTLEKARALEAEAAIKTADGLRFKLFGKVMNAPSLKQALGFV